MNATTITATIAEADAIIGSVTFAERSEPRTEHHTSYAADYRTFTVLPGNYKARLARNAHDVHITVDIEVTHEALHSGFGGRNFATDRDDTVRKTTKTFNLYSYEVARAASAFRPELCGGAFKLDPAWCVITQHDTFEDGRHYTSNKLAKLS